MKLTSLFFGLAALLCAGCQTIKPFYEIDSDAYLVVKPVLEPAAARSAWDSSTGHDIARLVTTLLSEVEAFEVVPYSTVQGLMYEPPDEHGPHASDATGLDVRALTDIDLADLTGADYVLVCKILELRTKAPGSVNLIGGKATVQVDLFDVHAEVEPEGELDERELKIRDARERHGLRCPRCAAKARPRGSFVARAVVSATFPNEHDPQYGDPFLNQAVVRERLVKRLAAKIAGLLYERDPDE